MLPSQSFAVAAVGFIQQDLESLTAELDGRGVSLATGPPPCGPYVTYVNADEPEFKWTPGNAESVPRRIGMIVSSSLYSMSFIRLALEHGASVVHTSMRSAAVADVIVARSNGELLIPIGVASALANGIGPTRLLPGEVVVLRLLAEHRTVAAVASAAHYSERHVRRILQSLHLKAGTSDREEMMRLLNAAIGH